ncbi:MAG TPA: hypothetical protein VF550_16065 [Polyangia bacterium]
MTKETLLYALGAEGLKVANDGVAIPDERDASFLVSAPGETIQVGKVIKLELRDRALCLETNKGERYWFSYDLVLGMRVRAVAETKAHGAGFARGRL